MVPHRGGMVLTLGILSIVVSGCLPIVPRVLGWLAMQYGKQDIEMMDRGAMDPSGRSLATAGRICGIVGLVLGCINTVLLVFWLVFFVLMGVAGGMAP